MSGIHSVAYRLTESLSDTFKYAFRATIGDFYGRVIRGIDNLPQLMKNNPSVAFGVIVTTNTIFFTIVNRITNWLNKKLEDKYPLNLEQKTYKYILLDGILVGGSVLVFNILLSKASNYPLSKITLAAITTAAIAVRYFAGHKSTKDEIAIKNEIAINIAHEAAKKAQEGQAAKKVLEEEAAKKAQEEQAAKKAQQEEAKKALEKEAAAKKALEEAAKKAQKEEAAAKKALEEAAKKAQKEEAAAKKALEEAAKKAQKDEAAAKKAREEEAAKKARADEAAKKELEVEAAKKAQKEEAAKKAIEVEAAKKVQKDEAAKKAQEVKAAKKAQKEEAAKKAQEAEAVKKAQKEEAAKKAQEVKAAKKAQKEEAAKKAQEVEAAKKAQEVEVAAKKAREEESLRQADPQQYVLNHEALGNKVFSGNFRPFGTNVLINKSSQKVDPVKVKNLFEVIKQLSPHKKADLEQRNEKERNRAFRKEWQNVLKLAKDSQAKNSPRKSQFDNQKEESQLK